MPGRPPLRALLLPLVLLAGCTSDPEPAPRATGPVDVTAPAFTDERVRSACASLVDSLPDEVDPGVTRRPVSGDARATAAWGDPPVTLVCGVPEPDRPEEPVKINGVDWSVRDIGAGLRFSTRGRAGTVAVDVPDAYGNSIEIINPLSGPVAAAFPTP